MPAWTDAAWLAEAHAWVDEQLAASGARVVAPTDQLHVRPWATVVRVPTDRGDFYFKANAPALAYEAALVALLAARRPDCIPELAAVDLERGWLLLADAGAPLRELLARERNLTRWLDVLPLYAEVQIDLASEVEDLVARGVPDLRLAQLPCRYEQLVGQLSELPPSERRRLEDSVALVETTCRELASFGVAETIQHDDFHDGQVYHRDGRYLLLDWGDACVSHPFFTMAVTLEGVIAWGLDDLQGSVDVRPYRDAYLEPFERLAPRAELVAACALATRLGWACRAVNGHAGGADLAETQVRLRMFLDGTP